MEPKDVPRLEGSELRRARAPSLRYLVKLALKCGSAEELGKRLRRRYHRQQQRSGMSASALTTDMAVVSTQEFSGNMTVAAWHGPARWRQIDRGPA